MVTVEKDVVGGIELAAVGTRGVVMGSCSEAVGIIALERVSCDELEGSGLVGAGVCGENSADEVGDGKAGWFP
jgi:hypothetical protein